MNRLQKGQIIQNNLGCQSQLIRWRDHSSIYKSTTALVMMTNYYLRSYASFVYIFGIKNDRIVLKFECIHVCNDLFS